MVHLTLALLNLQHVTKLHDSEEDAGQGLRLCRYLACLILIESELWAHSWDFEASIAAIQHLPALQFLERCSSSAPDVLLWKPVQEPRTRACGLIFLNALLQPATLKISA